MIKAVEFAARDNSAAQQESLPHVLLVLDQFPKSLGGGERIVLRLAALLPKYGYRVSILTFFIHPESVVFTMAPPCPVYTLALPKTYGLTALRAAFEFRRWIRQQKIQIVQTFFESSDIWAGFVVKTLSDAKLIWSRRDMGILRTRKHHISYRLMAGMPDRVFAVSEQVRGHCIEVDRIKPERVETIYNGLDLPDLPDLPDLAGLSNSTDLIHLSTLATPAKPSGRLLVTTVGNIRRVKGHDIFIKAAAVVALKFPQVSFSIAGEVLDADYFAELQAMVLDLNLDGRFHFVGGITNVPEHLATADIFVLPSRSEGFSNSIIEAMASALPVVATNVGGNAEAVKDGLNGFIVPPEDTVALTEAISRLLADPIRSRQMGAEGKLLAAKKFTTGAMMHQITTVYAALLAKN